MQRRGGQRLHGRSPGRTRRRRRRDLPPARRQSAGDRARRQPPDHLRPAGCSGPRRRRDPGAGRAAATIPGTALEATLDWSFRLPPPDVERRVLASSLRFRRRLRRCRRWKPWHGDAAGERWAVARIVEELVDKWLIDDRIGRRHASVPASRCHALLRRDEARRIR